MFSLRQSKWSVCVSGGGGGGEERGEGRLGERGGGVDCVMVD